MNVARRSLLAAPVLCAIAAPFGCSMEAPADDSGMASEQQLVTNVNAIMQRAQEWVDKRVPYCGGVRGGHDALCGGTCSRPAEAWDGYRTDCSGYVSWAWQIPDVPTTYVYIDDRGGENGWRTVAPNELQRGDALVCAGHIKLFNRFIDRDTMEIYEEYDCGRVARIARESISRLGGNAFRFNGDARIYHGIRRNALAAPIDPAPSPEITVEASQAYVLPTQHHFFGRLKNGDLRHSYWDAGTKQIQHDTWGSGIVGTPVALALGAEQHAWARGTDGSLQHWRREPTTNKIERDVWSNGLSGDPAAIAIGDAQHVWAIDDGGALQHFWFAPNMKEVGHDTWGSGVMGRPSAMVDGEIQHVFARGKSGTIEHFWWAKDGLKHERWGDGIASDPAARVISGDRHVWAVDAGGSLQHWWWTPRAQRIEHDTWAENANLAADRPSTMYVAGAQHVFARGNTGALEHWWWDTNGGVHHDTWGQGIASAPSALLIGVQHHAWATNANGDALHWFWTPEGMMHDNWAQ